MNTISFYILLYLSEKLPNGAKMHASDNGTGIPDSVKAKIFQPFFTTEGDRLRFITE